MVQEKVSPLFRQKLELLILTESEAVLNRAKQIISSYYLNFRHLNFKDLPEQHLPRDLMKAQLILVDQEEDEDLKSFTVRVDRILTLFPRGQIVTLMSPSFSRENLEGSQNPRVVPLSHLDFFSTIKFEYLSLCRCRSQYFEIQKNDLFPMTKMLFPAFVRLTLNQRYLAVVYSSTILSDERFARLPSSEGLFVQVKDSENYLKYIETYFDRSGVGVKKRARALFLTIYHLSLRLNEILFFDFKSISEFQIQRIFEDVQRVGAELVDIIKGADNLWDVFREAHGGDFTHLWRAPWVTVYGMMISVKSGVGDPLTVLLSGLLTDVGLYDLEEKIVRDFLFSNDRAPIEAMPAFQQHPIISLNRCLIKKIPLSEAVKATLVCTHERADEQGFPNQVPKDKLPVEALILRFAEKIDHGVLTTMKQTGVSFRFLKEKIWETEESQPGQFSSEFLASIADSLI